VTTPKRQHFIPRLHLQHFVGQEPKGQVWSYESQTGQTRSAVPEQTAVESHFYSVENKDGSMNTGIETKLAEIEDKAAPIYEALLSGNIPLVTQQRADFATFLALMYVRTPAMRRMAAEVISRNVQTLNYAYGTNDKAFDALNRRAEQDGARVLTAEEKERLRQTLIDPTDYIIEIPRERTLQVLGAADKLAPLFFKMRWSLVNPQNGFFITSDNPIVRLVDPQSCHPVYGDGGFMNKTAETLFPLSPKLLLLMSWQSDTLEKGLLARENVDKISRAFSGHADRYLYAHIKHKRVQQLAEEFKDSRPGITTEGFGPEKFADMRLSRRSKK
jgi:hypothetical protein